MSSVTASINQSSLGSFSFSSCLAALPPTSLVQCISLSPLSIRLNLHSFSISFFDLSCSSDRLNSNPGLSDHRLWTTITFHCYVRQNSKIQHTPLDASTSSVSSSLCSMCTSNGFPSCRYCWNRDSSFWSGA